MRRRDGDPARLLLGCRVDLVIRLELAELLPNCLVIAAVSVVLPWST
jgi:hypothetical protein